MTKLIVAFRSFANVPKKLSRVNGGMHIDWLETIQTLELT